MSAIEAIERAKIINSGDEVLIERVREHLGEEFLHMSPDVAAMFDTGDLQDSDPRSRAALKISGEESRRGR